MTRYIGGCFRCGGHEGDFEAYLPNGVCVGIGLAGAYFCETCEKKIKESPKLLKEQVEKWQKTNTGYGYVAHRIDRTIKK